jgi:hypothetical protein
MFLRAPFAVPARSPKRSAVPHRSGLLAHAEGVCRPRKGAWRPSTATGAAPAGHPLFELRARLRAPSTDPRTFSRPHPGDCGVVQIVSTGCAGERRSGQVSRLWIRGRTISTDCGRREDPQAVQRVVHRRPTGWRRLSPANPGFSTPLSTVRQRDAPSHRVE